MTDDIPVRSVTEPRNQQDKPAQNPPMNAREEWMDFMRTALIAVVLALVVRTFLLEPFNIPSGSMKPTLEIGDYLFVNKPAYGYSRYSFPFGLAPIEGRIWTRGAEPQRGDVVVFKLPTNPSIDYIKRIVGMPGEKIQVMNGILHIDGQPVHREPVGLRRDDEGGVPVPMMEYIETLPGGVMHSIYEESDSQPLDNTPEYAIPPGHYFMMGDNRDNSQDSRVGELVGFVPAENIVGRAWFLFFSTNGHAGLAEFWKWPWTVRYDRLFQGIGPVRPPGQDNDA
jgi:signal peptidase I